MDVSQALFDVLQSRARIKGLNSGKERRRFFADADIMADSAAIIIHMIDGSLDPERLHAARDHFLATIQLNRRFWAAVETETDNATEWIPNDRQQSALPIEFPPELGVFWMAVLDDVQAVLKGELLLPHWRFSLDQGINAAAFIETAPDVDLIAILQGEGVLAFVETGESISRTKLRAFEGLVAGNSPLFMLLLN